MNYKDVNDYEVIYLIKENDEDSKTLLYKKYEPLITSFSLQYLPVAKKCGLELVDLIQEGYIGFSNALNSYDENKNILFYTLVRVCVKRQILNLLRKSMTMKHSILNYSFSLNRLVETSDNELELGNIFVSPEILPIEHVINSDFEQEIIKRAYSMSLMSRCVFLLKYNNFKISEIAVLLDLTVKKVRDQLEKARLLFGNMVVNK